MKRKITAWCLALLAAISAARAEDVLQVEPFEAVPGSTTEDGRYFVVRLDDTQDYWGVQFDLYLPEGMELDDEGGFSPFELSTERFPHSSRGGQITFKHGVDYTQFASRWYRILISPNDVESYITGREGELLKIYYTTSDDLQPGIHPILVRGALFVVTGVYGVEPPNSASYCTVGPSPLQTERHVDLSGLTGLLPSFVVESLAADMADNSQLCSVDLTGADTLTVPLTLPHTNVLQLVNDTSRYAKRLAAAATPNVRRGRSHVCPPRNGRRAAFCHAAHLHGHGYNAHGAAPLGRVEHALPAFCPDGRRGGGCLRRRQPHRDVHRLARRSAPFRPGR